MTNRSLRRKRLWLMETSTASSRVSLYWAIASIVVAVLIVFFQYYFFTPPPDPKSPVSIRIEPGSSTRDVASILKENKLIWNETLFLLTAKLIGADVRIQPGLYPFEHSMTMLALLDRLEKPGGEGGVVKLLEGWTIAQFASELKSIGIDSTEFMAAAKNKVLLESFGIDADNAEGYLFPDTYKMLEGTTPVEAVKRMLRRFREVVPDSLEQLARRRFNFSLHELVTFASIVEAEVQNRTEGPLVSAVYHNRLKKGMLLQADPTIQYVLPEGPRRLLTKDLSIDSPYNTYLYKGLPPGPICAPGKAAFQSSLNPAPVKYLFFVSQADGSHAFNETISGHLKSKVVLDSARAVVKQRKLAERDSLRRIKAAELPASERSKLRGN
ncbi:MAG: endolytic transglycosylase MltG [bacterium]|nr:endolytic transglycosylase MltG [bacterium]